MKEELLTKEDVARIKEIMETDCATCGKCNPTDRVCVLAVGAGL